MSNECKAVFKYALALVFLFSHAVSYAGAPGNDVACNAAFGKVTKEIKACQSMIKAAQLNSGVSDDSMNKNAGNLATSAGIGKGITKEGKEKCKAVYDACSEPCAGASAEQKCENYKKYSEELALGESQNAVTEQQAIDTQTATNGDQQQPAGGGDMMGMLMGAGIGGLLGYMIAKKMNEDKEEEQPETPIDGALLPTGQFDCSKGDAYMYGECNAWLEANCAGSETPACKKFERRYCGSDPGQVKASGGFVGEGIGTPFCKTSVAANFCKGQGRQMCPSCLGLARNNSAACQQDPSLCLAQNSTDQINEAKKSCPTDPAFADPNYTAGGGSQVPSGLNDGSLPAVVLPQSVTQAAVSGAATGASSASAKASGSSSGISVASVGGSAGASQGSAEGAIREGSASGSSYNSSGAGSSYSSGAIAGAVARDVASTKGGVRYRTASADGRPSDVEGPFGPSLFKTSTEVIKSRCDAGKLNNCP